MSNEHEYSMSDFNRLFLWTPFEVWLTDAEYTQLWWEMKNAYWDVDKPKEMRDKKASSARDRALEAARDWGLVHVRRPDGVGFPYICRSENEYQRRLNEAKRAAGMPNQVRGAADGPSLVVLQS